LTREKKKELTDLFKYNVDKVVRNINRNPTNKKAGKGAEPCILSDVKHLKRAISDLGFCMR
jgi:hypothetical protein